MRRDELPLVIRKNWWVGIFAAGTYVYLHDYKIAAGVGLLMLAWNLLLYRVLSRAQRSGRESGGDRGERRRAP